MGKWKKTAQIRYRNKKEILQDTTGNEGVPKTRAAIGQVRDANSRMMFKDPNLCAQFLRDNVDIPFLKDIQPEDISDVSEKYQAYLGISFETDTVKKIRLHDEENTELYLISLIEHKSRVDYNIAMQLLRYMVCIWTEYAREMEEKHRGSSKSKAFRYPPVLPVVYYEGKERWTADMHLRDRIHLKEVFGEFFPDFTYKLVRIHDYTNEELLKREDEFSFLMMINRIQTPEDMSRFLQVEQETVKRIADKASPQTLEIIASTVWSLCMKMNVPVNEAEECVKKVKGRDMGYLFENMEKMDIQEERRKTAEARKEAQKAQEEAKTAQKELQEAQKEAQAACSRARKSAVLLCQKLGVSKEGAIRELVTAYSLDREEAQRQVALYWQEKEGLQKA